MVLSSSALIDGFIGSVYACLPTYSSSGGNDGY